MFMVDAGCVSEVIFSFQVLLAFQLISERLVDRTGTIFGSVIPEAVAAMPVIGPSGVIQNRIEANAFHGDAEPLGGAHFRGDIS
jgi:hypothetical protein